MKKNRSKRKRVSVSIDSAVGQEDDSTVGEEQDQERATTCTECKRRKQKCDRQIPCGNCTARGTQQDCQRSIPFSRLRLHGARLDTLEREVGQYRTLLCGLRQLLQTDNPDHQSTGPEAGPGPFSSPCRLARPKGERSQADNLSSTNRNGNNDAEDKQMSNLLGIAQHYTERGSNDSSYHRLPDLKGSIVQIGGSLSLLQGLIDTLPSRSTCEDLVDYFFERLNCIRLPLPQSKIRQSFRDFWDNESSITLKDLNTFALLTSISAISLLTLGRPTAKAQDLSSSSMKVTDLELAKRLHFASRQTLMLSSMLSNESLDQIIGWIMCCRFLLLEQRLGEAYTCAARLVKSSFRLKLHRDGTELNQMINNGVTPHATWLSNEEIIVRRIIWSAVYHFDRFISLHTGLPYSIIDDFCSTHAPSIPVSSDDVFCMSNSARKHLRALKSHAPSPFAYCVHRHGLSALQGRLLLVSRGQPSLARHGDVQEEGKLDKLHKIDKDLSHFESTLPYFLRIFSREGIVVTKQHAFINLDRYFTFVPVQRYLLNIEILALRMAIFGPYLLRASLSRAARASCVRGALKTIELDAYFKNNHGDLTENELEIYTGGPQLFHATLICALEWYRITKEERSGVKGKERHLDVNDTKTLSAHVSHFLSEREAQGFQSKVEETQIIKLFYDHCERMRPRHEGLETHPAQFIPEDNAQGCTDLLKINHTSTTQAQSFVLEDITLPRLFGFAEAYQEKPEGIDHSSHQHTSNIFAFSDHQSRQPPATSSSDDLSGYHNFAIPQPVHVQANEAQSMPLDPPPYNTDEATGNAGVMDPDEQNFWQQIKMLLDCDDR